MSFTIIQISNSRTAQNRKEENALVHGLVTEVKALLALTQFAGQATMTECLHKASRGHAVSLAASLLQVSASGQRVLEHQTSLRDRNVKAERRFISCRRVPDGAASTPNSPLPTDRFTGRRSFIRPPDGKANFTRLTIVNAFQSQNQ